MTARQPAHRALVAHLDGMELMMTKREAAGRSVRGLEQAEPETRARWIITRDDRDMVLLTYENLVTGKSYPLGEQPAYVEDDAVLIWVLTHGGAAVGDQLVLSCGSVLMLLRTGLVLVHAQLACGTRVTATAMAAA